MEDPKPTPSASPGRQPQRRTPPTYGYTSLSSHRQFARVLGSNSCSRACNQPSHGRTRARLRAGPARWMASVRAAPGRLDLRHHEHVSPAEAFAWAAYNLVVYAIVPLWYFRRRYSAEALNLRSGNRRADARLIAVILSVETLVQITALDLGIFNLTAGQLAIGLPFTFVLYLAGAVLPAIIFIYAILVPRFLRLTGSATTTVILGGLTYTALHVWDATHPMSPTSFTSDSRVAACTIRSTRVAVRTLSAGFGQGIGGGEGQLGLGRFGGGWPTDESTTHQLGVDPAPAPRLSARMRRRRCRRSARRRLGPRRRLRACPHRSPSRPRPLRSGDAIARSKYW